MTDVTIMNAPRRRLSEQDMAQLYMQTEAPLRLDALIQGMETGDDAQIAIHDSIRTQTPDLALISLSLCALIIARDFPLHVKDGPAGPILRELIVSCEDNLYTVGRLWIDSACHDIAPDPVVDKETILSIPDRLRILTSIFMEMRDFVAMDEGSPMYFGLNTLYYQAESHADIADMYVEKLTGVAGSSAKKPIEPRQSVPNHVPLPYALSAQGAGGGTVVPFNLFHRR